MSTQSNQKNHPNSRSLKEELKKIKASARRLLQNLKELIRTSKLIDDSVPKSTDKKNKHSAEQRNDHKTAETVPSEHSDSRSVKGYGKNLVPMGTGAQQVIKSIMERNSGSTEKDSKDSSVHNESISNIQGTRTQLDLHKIKY